MDEPTKDEVDEAKEFLGMVRSIELTYEEQLLGKLIAFFLRRAVAVGVAQVKRFDLTAVEGLATCRAIELLEILTLKTIALRRGLVTQEELDETECELTAAAPVDEMLAGDVGSRLTLMRQLERRLLASRGEAE